SFHPLVRDFVTSKRPQALFEQASERHCAYFAAVLEKAAADYREAPIGALDKVASDIDNVLRAIEWALDASDPAIAVTMMSRLVVVCDYLQARAGGCEMAEM